MLSIFEDCISAMFLKYYFYKRRIDRAFDLS